MLYEWNHIVIFVGFCLLRFRYGMHRNTPRNSVSAGQLWCSELVLVKNHLDLHRYGFFLNDNGISRSTEKAEVRNNSDWMNFIGEKDR